MSTFNKIILIGRLTRDPELRYTPNGTPVAHFTLAVDRRRPSKEGERETDFIDIVAWQKLAEICQQFLGKGRLVAVEGRLQIRNYETQDGQKRKAVEVIANEMQILDKPKNTDESAPRSETSPQAQSSTSPEPAAEEAAMLTTDDVPF